MTADIRVLNEYLEQLIMHPTSSEEVRDRETCFYKWSFDMPYSSEIYDFFR